MQAIFSRPARTIPTLLFVLWASSGIARSEPNTAAELLPSTTVAYAELSGVDDLIGIVLDHPLRKKVEGLDQYKQFYASKQYLDFRAGVAIFEAQLGKPWRAAVNELTKGGVYAGLDAPTQGGAVFVKAESEAALEKFIETFVRLARADAKEKGNADPIETGEYRGVKAFKFENNRVARLGQWLIVTNKSELGKKIIDAYKDGQDDSLANNERFKQARKARPKNAKLWAFVDVETIRKAGIANQVFQGKAENPVVELLIGGLLSTVQKTPYATLALEVESHRLAAEIETPHDSSWMPEEREFFFGPEGKGRAPMPVKLENQLFTLSTYRDFSQMWLRAGDLLDENTNDELAKADSNLSTFFSGKDFGEDILGSVHPEVQLVVTRQDFSKVLPKPSIKLPSFAIIARLRKPESMQRELRRIFQSLIGFLNVVGAMNGQPQLDLDMQRNGDALIVSSQYAPDDDEKESEKARINYNFSPTVAFRKEVLIISSTTELAEKIVQQARIDQGESPDNTRASVDVGELQKVLATNREHLIAQNMLEDGNTREEAEKQIGLLLSLLNIVDDASIRLSPGENSMRLGLQIQLKKDIQP